MANPGTSGTASGTDVLVTATAFGGGGTERYVEDLAVGLFQRGVKAVVSVDSGPLDRVRRLIAGGVPIRVLGDAPLEDPKYAQAFRAMIDDLRPRLIHVNGWAHDREIIEAATSCGIPLIYTNHCTPRPPLLRDWLGINKIPFAFYRQRALAERSGPAISISELGLKNLGRASGIAFLRQSYTTAFRMLSQNLPPRRHFADRLSSGSAA